MFSFRIWVVLTDCVLFEARTNGSVSKTPRLELILQGNCACADSNKASSALVSVRYSAFNSSNTFTYPFQCINFVVWVSNILNVESRLLALVLIWYGWSELAINPLWYRRFRTRACHVSAFFWWCCMKLTWTWWAFSYRKIVWEPLTSTIYFYHLHMRWGSKCVHHACLSCSSNHMQQGKAPSFRP